MAINPTIVRITVCMHNLLTLEKPHGIPQGGTATPLVSGAPRAIP